MHASKPQNKYSYENPKYLDHTYEKILKYPALLSKIKL
jgi:hypothetical protein